MRTEQATARNATTQERIGQELIRALLDHSSTGTFLSDPSGLHIELNSHLRDMLGFSQDDPASFSLKDFVSLEELADEFVHAGKAPEPSVITQSKTLRCKDGQFLPVEVALRILPDGHLLGTVRDTPPAGSGHAMAGKSGGIIARSVPAILALDLNNFITCWNPAAEQMFGYPKDEVLGKHVKILAPHGGDDGQTAPFIGSQAGEPVDQCETSFRRKDGTLINICLTISPITTRGGKVIGTSAVAGHISGAEKTLMPPDNIQVLQNRLDELAAAHADLRQTADGLIEQRHRYYELFDAVPYGYVVTNRHGAIIDINRAALKLLGLERSSADRTPILGFISSRDHGVIRAIMTRIQRGLLEEAKDVEVSVQPLNGRAPAFTASLTVGTANLETHSKELRWVLRDVTERRKAEKALRRSERRFRRISELSADFAYSINVLRDGTLTVSWFTEALEHVTGLPASMLCQPNGWRWLCHPHDKTTFEAHLEKLLSGQHDVCEFRIVTQSAQVRWLRDSAQPRRDSHGRVTEILGSAQDITDRKQAEEALRESEERFRTTFYSIGDGVMTTDAGATIIRMNRLAESLTGWSETEARGRHIDDVFRVIDEVSGSALRDPVGRALNHGTPFTQTNQLILVSRDGKRHPIAASASPIRDSLGVTTGAVVIFHDQTELRTLQEKILLSHKMDAVGLLAGGVAHDFNNVLAIILGLATLIKRSLKPADPMHGQVETILCAAKRSANLTKQLLAFARKQIVDPVPLNLNSSLASLREMLQQFVGEDVSLRLLPGKALWNIRIDPGQIDQILTNLTTNARDAIKDVGTITIETRNAVITDKDCRGRKDVDPGEYVMLVFTDTGEGMDETVLPRIFDPFFTTKPRGKGTGLGLPTVFGIVKQNNGYIEVHSRPGNGTTLEISFPRFRGEIVVPDGEPDEKSLRGPETILIVEDEAQLLDLFAQTLEGLGYHVLRGQSPTEAIALCHEQNGEIDLLVTDVIMPEMNGRELAQLIIKEGKPGMKVLFNSGYPGQIVAQRGIIDQGTNFLQKPFTPLELARKVREVLRG